MYVGMYVCMNVCMGVCVYMFLYVCMNVCLSACLSVCLSVCLHVCMYVFLYVCMYVCLSVCMYVCKKLWSSNRTHMQNISVNSIVSRDCLHRLEWICVGFRARLCGRSNLPCIQACVWQDLTIAIFRPSILQSILKYQWFEDWRLLGSLLVYTSVH